MQQKLDFKHCACWRFCSNCRKIKYPLENRLKHITVWFNLCWPLAATIKRSFYAFWTAQFEFEFPARVRVFWTKQIGICYYLFTADWVNCLKTTGMGQVGNSRWSYLPCPSTFITNWKLCLFFCEIPLLCHDIPEHHNLGCFTTLYIYSFLDSELGFKIIQCNDYD